nr:aminopeptidase [bacterium]
MKDARMEKLAKVLIEYSCRLQKGERVLIEATDIPEAFVCALVEAAYRVGALPYVQLHSSRVERALRREATSEQLAFAAGIDAKQMQGMQAYIGVRGSDNGYEYVDVPTDKNAIYQRDYSTPVHSLIRVPHTKWVVLRWPTPAFAQSAGMSTEAFEDFYFNVCCLDYSRMDRAMDALKARMERTDRVRLTGPDTDISFSIKGMPAVKCAGECNIPDGEIYTAPIRDSINGTITFHSPQLRDGFLYRDIALTFKDGRIVEAHANDDVRVNAVLDTDEGARYVGEFAIGVNPYITRAIGDTLFDEKITGSIHFTPGSCYDNADNGNQSAIHWDLVLLQDAASGGGDIWFDGELIRHDGRFVPEDLQCLNPEALM